MNRKQFTQYIKENIKEILSEEVAYIVKGNKGTVAQTFKNDDEAKKFDASATNVTLTKLEEMSLNEMAFSLKKGIKPSEKIEPRYKKENYKKVVDLILSKVDDKKTMADIARELGVVQQKIRPVVADLINVGILEKGEAESKSGKNTDNKPNPKEETPKAKKA